MYALPFNMSTAFHNYAILWGLDDIVKVYADNVQVLSFEYSAPEARFGSAGFGKIIISIYHNLVTFLTNL